ncbi:MAG: dihydrolipoyl dehydrogenase [Kiritimatiellae bacterium]|nr:dihydrolipoyl dehydrogenase [Kiritimatiellia bacterium]
MTPPTSLTILGAGPAGYPAAFLAADLGVSVTLIESDNPLGGTCLHRGCIPSKSLLHAARLLTDARDASALGLDFPPPVIRLDALRAWKDSVTTRMAQGLAQLAKARAVRVITARAAFASPTQLQLTAPDGTTTPHDIDTLLLATGSAPSPPPGFPTEHPHLWDSTTALELPEIPDTLLVIGGGYIGLELGSVYAALGSRVTVVEMTGGLLPGVDRDLMVPLAKRLRESIHAIQLHTRVVDITDDPAGLRVTFDNTRTGETSDALFAKVLVATGRRPYTDGLALDRAGLATTDHGFIAVDANGRTAQPHIHAAGDVAGQPLLAHKATHEARALVARLAGRPASMSPHIPAVVFTDPEIAWVGLTETQARAQQRDVRVSKFPWAASGRASTLNRADGSTKILADPGTGKLLGVGLAGAGAGDLISEAALALEMGATAADLTRTIHPPPTLAETLGEAAELHAGLCAHLYRPRRTT